MALSSLNIEIVWLLGCLMATAKVWVCRLGSERTVITNQIWESTFDLQDALGSLKQASCLFTGEEMETRNGEVHQGCGN